MTEKICPELLHLEGYRGLLTMSQFSRNFPQFSAISPQFFAIGFDPPRPQFPPPCPDTLGTQVLTEQMRMPKSTRDVME